MKIKCKYATYHNDGQMHSMSEDGYKCCNETIKNVRSIDCPFDWNNDLGKLICKFYEEENSDITNDD